MKRFFTASILFLLILQPVSVRAQQVLLPVGQIVGLHIKDDSVTVAAFDETLGASAQQAGLEIGDQLLTIEGQPVRDAQDIQEVLQENPQTVELTVSRGSKQKVVKLQPQMSSSGPKLGIYLRQGISGIGTVTWYDPSSGKFGTLGHGVSSRQGMLCSLREGEIYRAEISSVIPGKSGHPGLLKGTSSEDGKIGFLYRNSPQGVFGETEEEWKGQVLPVAAFEEVHTGEAWIRSTVSDQGPQDYSVEILKIYPKERADCRNFLLKVTDSRLLSQTGGIVQGMSGSPIIQDGRLVGAVTHVMVSDPTTGYGIFIGNMLDAAA